MMLRRIYPDADSVVVENLISGLALGDRAPDDRPFVICNMVSTADGKAAVDGRTTGIGNDADRVLFHNLRTQVDAVMVGAGTVRAERYGPLIRDRALREKRRVEGLEPMPLACVVSGGLDLPLDLPLLQDPKSRILVLTASEGELGACPARVEYLRAERPERPGREEHKGARTLALQPLLRTLRIDHGIRSVLCEGGPTLNYSLLEDRLFDELFLSFAPKLIGGSQALTIVAGSGLAQPRDLELVWALEADGHLFLRYRLVE